MTWNLERPEPVLPSSYFWTWDHSTNWVLDDPGLVTFGCGNKYLKHPETYVEDYRRLTDLAAGLGVRGITIWGFLRDSHGGIEAGKRVADYAASRRVAIMPGVGTNWYGGCYYEGEHPYNIETFLAKHPEARMVNPEWEALAEYRYGAMGVNPTHPLFVEWLQEGVRWLFKEFAIGGANVENGDFIVDYSEGSQAHKKTWPPEDPDFFRMQFLGYDPALRAVEDLLPEKLVAWATYTGFVPGENPDGEPQIAYLSPYMRCKRPALLDRMPRQATCQWTLTQMVLDEPLPLTAFLDDGAPEAVFENRHWPRDLENPAPRAVGFLHQGCQWHRAGRYHYIIGTIKEACLRAFRSGFEGVGIHGEVTSRHVPWALNYLAFSHFIHWPEDTLRDFGRKTLGQVFGDEEEGEGFVEILAHCDAGSLTEQHKADVQSKAKDMEVRVSQGEALERWRFWQWLRQHVQSGERQCETGFF